VRRFCNEGGCAVLLRKQVGGVIGQSARRGHHADVGQQLELRMFRDGKYGCRQRVVGNLFDDSRHEH
jgi:hypothetical protein